MVTKPRTAAEQKFWDKLFELAWEKCLSENGLQGAIGCASLARDAADAAFEQRRNSARPERNSK